MAFRTNKFTDKSEDKKTQISIVQLTREEVGILLQLVKNSNFNGNMIDALYHLTAKLQKEYLKGE
tara:strand:+ start:390 stop:584 length:195 start_codon:yes stop_codon:yes gene_type:complete